MRRETLSAKIKNVSYNFTRFENFADDENWNVQTRKKLVSASI